MERRTARSLCTGLTLLLAACASQALAPTERDAALVSLIEAERTFARTASQIGYRAAFIEFFAADGIGFYPHPSNTRSLFTQRPPRPDPPLLEWGPDVAESAASGELGYTAGPSRFLRAGTREVLSYGRFFSVWKREAGIWRVAVDVGIQTPPSEVPPPRVVTPASGALLPAFARADACDEVRTREHALSGNTSATLAALTDYARLHRDGVAVVVGAGAIARFVNGSPQRAGWQLARLTDHCLAAASGDLGATWGRVMEGERVHGCFVRSWRRDERGAWRIALDAATELGPQ